MYVCISISALMTVDRSGGLVSAELTEGRLPWVEWGVFGFGFEKGRWNRIASCKP